MIEFNRVSKRYADHDALRDVSLTIGTGEMVFLTGHSGAGKTTFLRLLMLLERASMGTLRVDGRDTSRIKGRNIGRYRGEFGIVFQDHQLLYDRSVLENVALPLEIAGFRPRDIQRRTRAALDKVGLLGREKVNPAVLSGGEQQRVAIARSMANAPRVLLADEPTGNLDPDTAKDVFHHLSMITRATGTAALVVTHNQQLALNMDSILTISGGKIVSIG